MMSCALKPFLCAKVETMLNMIDKSDKNWRVSVYYPDDYAVYDELKRQLELKYKDQVQAVYSGCDAIHDGIHCDGAHGDSFTFEFQNRIREEDFSITNFVKEKN